MEDGTSLNIAMPCGSHFSPSKLSWNIFRENLIASYAWLPLLLISTTLGIFSKLF
jgi:hypothetical protein